MDSFELKDWRYVLHNRGEEKSVFILSDADEGQATKYYGYLNENGNWFIQRWDSSLNQNRFISGKGNYAANWTARASLTPYDYFNTIV